MLSWNVRRQARLMAWTGGAWLAAPAFGQSPGGFRPAAMTATNAGWALAGAAAVLLLAGWCRWRSRKLERKARQQALEFHLDTARQRALFDNTPVQILEEDLSAVAAALVPLRNQGIKSLGQHLLAHPEAPREWLRLARLVDANQPAVAAAGCASKAELVARFPQLDTLPYQEIFVRQMDQLWAGSHLFEEELRYLDAQGQERVCLAQCRVTEREGRIDPARVVLVLLDITTAKRTVASQMENQELLRKILGRANILLWWAQVRREDGHFRWKINVPSQSFDSPIFKLATALDQGGLWDIDHAPDLTESSKRADEAILSGRSGYEQTFRIISQEGVTHWLSEDVGISRLGEKEWSFVGVVRDVTEQHRAEVERAKSLAQLQLVLDRADVMLWQAHVTDQAGKLVWRIEASASGLQRRIFGDAEEQTRRNAINDPDRAFYFGLSTLDRAAMDARSTAALRSGAPGYEQEFRLVKGDQILLLHERVSITPVGPGQWSLVGVVVDMSAEKAAEAARAASEARLRQILTRADCLLWYVNVRREGAGLLWRGFTAPDSVLSERLFGRKPAATISCLWDAADTPELAEMNRRSETAILSGAPGYEQEFPVRRPRGTLWLHEQVSITPAGPDEWNLVGVLMDVTARREAEEARKQTATQLQEILNRADCLLWNAEASRAGEGIRWSGFTMPNSVLIDRLFGGSPPATGTGLWYPKDTPDLDEMNRRSVQAVLSGAPGYEQEFPVRRPQGTLWLHEQVSITPAGPDKWNLVGVLMDVTARREAEEARKKTEAQLQEILARTDCMLWQARVEEADGRMTWDFDVPDSSLKQRIFTGPAIIQPHALYDVQTVPELPAMNERCWDALRRGVPNYEQEFRIVKPERTYWLHERVSITPRGPGRWLLFGVLIDLTALKEAEQIIRSSEERYRLMFDSNPNPLLVFDSKTFRFLAVNDAAVQLYGYSRDEFLALKATDIRPPEEVPLFYETMRTGSAGPQNYGLRRHRAKDGRILEVDIASSTLIFQGQHARMVFVRDVTEERRTRAALGASETRYRDLFENAVEGVYQTNAEGRFVNVNPSLAQIFGCVSPQEFMEWTGAGALSLYVKPGRRADFFAELGARDSVTDFESEVRCRDGTTKWITENVRAVRDSTGQLLHMQGFLADVTERRRAMEAVRESEGRYRALFENMPLAILELDLCDLGRQLQIIRAGGVKDLTAHLAGHPEVLEALAARFGVAAGNQAAAHLFQARSEEQFRRDSGRLFSPDSHRLVRLLVAKIWQGDNDGELEMSLVDFGGRSHDVYLHWWMPRPDEPLMLKLAVVALVDLTELKRAEAELAAEKERLTVTLRSMSEGVITTDTQGVVQYMNRAAAEMTQQDALAAIGRPLAEICVLQEAQSNQIMALPVLRVLEEGALVDLPPQTALVGRAGGTCLVEGCCAPVRDAQSRLIGAVLVIRDITVRQRFEEELQRASRLESIGILAGGIAHDFNNILTAIMGNITLALLDAQALTKTEHYLRDAERAALRARDLTQQLLTFAKGGDPVRSAVLLSEIVTEVARFALHGSRVKCEYDLPENLWLADADKGQLGQVVQNLVINAVQAMPEGGTIRIGARNEKVGLDPHRPLVPGDYVHISVADTGTGIRPEHLAKIFDPYFTTKQQGSGLGLTTVYSIIKKHSGHIEVASELGRGTTFQLWLPAVCEHQLDLPEDSVPTATPLSGRVLFMDDEEPISLMASLLLQRIGLEVELARDGAEAVDKYKAAHAAGRRFDLVVLDLTVPGGMGGREAIGELNRIDPTVKAIVSSGYSSDPVMANFRAYGFRGVVAKPYRIDDFVRVLRDVLRESRPPMGSRPPLVPTPGPGGEGAASPRA
jgi:PAS domain S-box-containing protein